MLLDNSRYRTLTIVLIFIVTAIIAGFGLGFWSQLVDQFGIHFADDQMSRGYVYAVIWAFLLSILISIAPFDAKIHREIIWIWAARCFITLAFMLYYESFYKLDATVYFRHAKDFSFSNFPRIGDGTGVITWFSAVTYHYFPLGNSYHTLKVIWSFLGYCGCLLFYYSYVRYTGRHNKKLFWILNAFPSVLFWSSILGKDPIVLFGLGLLSYGAITSFNKPTFKSLILIGLGVLIASYIRMWLSVIFLVPYVIVFILKKDTPKNLKIGVALGMAVASTTVIIPFLKSFNIGNITEFFNVINILSHSWSRGGSGQSIQTIGSAKDFLLFLPLGIFTALFRPLIGEINNIFGILSGIENTLLLIFLANFFKNFKKIYFKNYVFFYIFLTITLWSILYSFISIQNLGTAVRFKLQILPFMLIMPFLVKTDDKLA